MFTSETAPRQGGKKGSGGLHMKTYIAELMGKPLDEVFGHERLKNAPPEMRKRVVGHILMDRMLSAALNTGWGDDGPTANKRAELALKATEFLVERAEGAPTQHVVVSEVSGKVDSPTALEQDRALLQRFVQKYGIDPGATT